MFFSIPENVALLIREQGFWRGLQMAPRKLTGLFLRRLAFNRGLRHELAAEGFDARFGTDTGEMLEGAVLGSFFSDTGQPVYRYETGLAAPLVSALQSLRLDFSQFVFLDLGCGKGKPMLLASHHPFKKIIGVDLSRRCLDIAKRNIEIYQKRQGFRAVHELVHASAEQFSFPDEQLIVYLLNPFPASVFAGVMKNLEASLTTHPRQILIFYANPKSGHIIESSPSFERIVQKDAPLAMYATRPAAWVRFL